MVSQESIRSTARQIAEKFKPDKIILFGLYAYGTPTEDSDVDMLVVMDYPKEWILPGFEIKRSINYAHPLDLIVRKPGVLSQRIALGDCFLQEITLSGKVLYESTGA